MILVLDWVLATLNFYGTACHSRFSNSRFINHSELTTETLNGYSTYLTLLSEALSLSFFVTISHQAIPCVNIYTVSVKYELKIPFGAKRPLSKWRGCFDWKQMIYLAMEQSACMEPV